MRRDQATLRNLLIIDRGTIIVLGIVITFMTNGVDCFEKVL